MQVTVLGAGTMGSGIAQITAMAGHEVRIRDLEESFLEAGLDAIRGNLEGGIERGKVTETAAEDALGRISVTTDLKRALADTDLVIEAVPEDLDLKKETFAAVEAHVSDGTTIASNTSTLPLTALAAELEQPDRAIGLHFFNPVHIMKPVEVIVAEQTSADTLAFAREFVDDVGKVTIEVNDSPGFATSRLGAALGTEAMRMVEEGVASASAIDRAMVLAYNHPVGPIELGDMNGLDVRLGALEHLRQELGERFRPPGVLKRKVQAGKLGRKTGEGFYVWEDGEAVGTSDEADR